MEPTKPHLTALWTIESSVIFAAIRYVPNMTDTGRWFLPMAENDRGLAAWCFYDWANSAFPTVLTTFVFAAYFTKNVAADEVSGTSQWGVAMTLSALAVAVMGPILGAVADNTGRRKPWLALFTLIAALSAIMLWTVKPDPAFIFLALTKLSYFLSHI